MRIGRARNHEEVVVVVDVVGDIGYALEQVCHVLQTDLAMASESGESKEKILAKRSEGRLFQIDIPRIRDFNLRVIIDRYS